MVISVLVDPQLFGPATVQTMDEAQAVEDLLQGLIDNGCLIMAPGETVRDLATITGGMPTLTGQYIEILVCEVINRQRCLEAKGFPGVGKGLPACDRLRLLAAHAAPDVAVYATDAERRCMLAAGNADLEICHLLQYRRSQAEQLRKSWSREAAPLHELDLKRRRQVLLHAIRYSQVITVADRYIARHVKQRQHKSLKEAIRGIAWLVDIWMQGSPLASKHVPVLRVISEGGPVPGCGFIDPEATKAEIQQRIKASLPHVSNLNVEVSLKRDASPPIFKDRFIRANNRTFLIRHSISDYGALAAQEDDPTKPSDVSPTHIHPCEKKSEDHLDRILGLPEA